MDRVAVSNYLEVEGYGSVRDAMQHERLVGVVEARAELPNRR